MPTYDYACQSCDHRFELVQSFSEDPISVCPSCEEHTVKKVFGVPAISFKGSGFYKTDSRSSNSSSSSKSNSGSNGTPSPKSESGASSKASEKSDSKKTPSKSAD